MASGGLGDWELGNQGALLMAELGRPGASVDARLGKELGTGLVLGPSKYQPEWALGTWCVPDWLARQAGSKMPSNPLPTY